MAEASIAELMEELRRRREPAECLRELRPAESLERSARQVPSGVPELDQLCGGWPIGALSEVVEGAGGASGLLYAALGAAFARGESCALVDPFRSLDMPSAQAAALPLERLLWVCPPDERRAARAVELLLESGGFALIVLDLRAVPPGSESLPTSVWLRLARRARTAAALVLALVSRPRVHAPALSLRVDCDARWQGDLRELRLRFQLRRGDPRGVRHG